jgi:hypothetical protein
MSLAMRMKPFFVGMILISLLAACAAPARTDQMVPASLAQDASTTLQTSPLKAQVAVGSVAGGSDTNPLWTSQVGTGEFRGALTAAISKFGLQSTGSPARYTLDASLLSLVQPMMGLDMTVTSTVLYKLQDTRQKVVVFEQHVVMPHTATFGDAFAGVERLKLANEGSIRRNLELAIADMIRKVKDTPPPTIPASSTAPTS